MSFLYRGRLFNFVDNVIDSDSVDGKEHLHTIKKYFFQTKKQKIRQNQKILSGQKYKKHQKLLKDKHEGKTKIITLSQNN